MAKHKDFKHRLQHLIDLKKINQKSVADSLGYTSAQLSKWISGTVGTPRRTTLQKLSNFFGCNIDWLANGTGEPFFSSKAESPEIVKTFERCKSNKEMDQTLAKIKRERFKVQCSAYLDGLMDFIGDNYGESPEDVKEFIGDVRRSNPKYEPWLEEEKKKARDNVQTDVQSKIAVNDK